MIRRLLFGGNERFSWCLFDFANSAFVTIMITAFYGRYFTDVIARGSRLATTMWGTAIALAMAIVALTSPLLGAVADRSGRKRTLLRSYVAVNVVACAGLYFAKPGLPYAPGLALVLIVLADVAFEGAYVFYNAFLAELAPPERAGRLSGYGWALGYVGGLGCLAIINQLGWVPQSYAGAVNESALWIPIAVAAWFAVFSVPMLTAVRERGHKLGAPDGGYLEQALRDVRESFRYIWSNRDLSLFFVAYLLYTDALETVIIFTGKFTGDALHFSPQDTVVLFLVLNVVAAPGAILFGWLVDLLGGVRGVGSSLVLWMAVVIGSVFAQTKGQFWPVAVVAAVGLGATQAASRAMVVRIVPARQVGRVFGMMTVVGRASAIVGPIVYGLVADLTHSARAAVATVGLFVVAGFVLLMKVNERRAMEAARSSEGQAEGSADGAGAKAS